MIKYKHTQYGLLIPLLFFVIVLSILYASYYQLGTKPIPITVAIILSIVFLLIIITFYKLTITIDNQKITASFGVGFIKKSFLINEIEFLEKVKIPWYYGIGIRLTPKGWLWNMKFGESILIQNKTKTKTFLVGTDEYETIVEILNQN